MTSPDEFRAVMRNLAEGVTVITTEADGEVFGVTATSFTSMSLEPPLVGVALAKTSRTHGAVGRSRKFAANILREDQAEIARKYAETMATDRFDRVDVKVGSTGMPLLLGVIGSLECRVTERFDAGDHTIFLGEVLEITLDEGRPLIYFQGEYRRLEGGRR